MNLYKSIIGVAVAIVVIMGTLVPYISAATFYDTDNSTITFEEYSSGSVDGWTLTATVDGSQLKVTSKFWTGTADDSTYILISDAGSVWYDGMIHSLMGSTYASYSTLDLSISDGKLTVGTTQYPITSVYLPTKNGNFGSHYDGSVNDPVASIGSFAGITLGTNAGVVFGDADGYLFGQSVIVGEDRKSIEIKAGNYVAFVPQSSPHQVQVKPGLDLDVYDDVDIFEREEFGTIEKGEIILPGIGDIFEDIDMGDVIVTPGKFPADNIQAVGNATSGTTGNCTWRIEGDTLYIDGTGVTGDYPDSTTEPTAPWGDTVRVAYIGEGVTTLGFNTFNHCTLLEEVHLPSTLTNLKSNSFRGCGLTHIDLPEGLLTLNYGTFRGSALESLICPESLTLFGQQAIEYCPNLTELYIPAGVTTIYNQAGTRFYALDGTYSNTPTAGSHYYGSSWREMNKTVTVEDGGLETTITYQGATLMSATDETVHIPYNVTYGGTDYPVKSIADGAVSGSSVRYVVIPQTVESISPTAITGSGIKEILNLSATEVTASHGEVRTSVPALAVIAEPVTAKGFGATASVLGIVPLILVAGAVLAIVNGFARARYD